MRSAVRWVTITGLIGVALAAGLSARAEEDKWSFRVAPYLWGPSVNGNLRVGDIGADFDLPIDEILKHHLDMAGMLNLEARKNRWGLLVDGAYMRISPESGTPGLFFDTIETTIDLAILDMAIGYRVIEGGRGWVDLLAGARYVDLTAELDMNPDYEAVDEISGAVTDMTVESVQGKVEGNVKRDADEIAADLAGLKEDVGDAARDLVREKVAGNVAETVENILDRIVVADPRGGGTALSLGDGRGTIGDAIRDEISDNIQDRIDEVGDAIRDAIADAVKQRIDSRIQEIQGNAEAIAAEIRKAAEESIDALRRNASKEVRQALDEAQRQLDATIEGGMAKAADADVEEDHEWVDPYIGVRGRLNITDRVYAGARADVGGFGVGSERTWQLFAGVGMKVTPNVEIETGWRHLDIDYEDGSFEMDLELSGAVVGMRFGL